MQGRMDIVLASLFVGSDLNLNWWRCGGCGGGSQVIRRDLQWTSEISTKSI